jgi:hypothetical protein
MTRFLRLSLLLLATTTGCVYSQTVRLPLTPQREEQLARVVIDDARPAADSRKTWLVGNRRCIRVYGDKYIEPSKIEYLRSLLAERLAPATKLVVRIERYDTIERCELTSKFVQQAGWEAGVAVATKGVVLSGPAAKGPGDDFALQLVGSANGVPFRFRRVFDYSDLKVAGLPSGDAEFRARLERLFGEFVELLRRPGAGAMTPESEIVDPRLLDAAPVRAAEAAPTPDPE